MSELTLFHYLREQSELLQLIERNEGEISAELEAALKANSTDLALKLDAWAASLNEVIPSHIDIISKHLDLWKARKAALVKKQGWMKQTLIDLMKSSGSQKLSGLRHSIALKSNPEKISLKDPEKWSDIPHQYLKFEVKLDKIALKRDWDILPREAKAQLVLESDLNLHIKDIAL